MDQTKTVDFLLENSSESILYRTKKEIIEKISLSEEQILQEKILQESDIRYIFELRQPDGWLGTSFHSKPSGTKPFDVCETALRFIAEKGIKLNHPIFNGVMNAYITRDKLDPIFDGCGKIDGYKYPCVGFWFLRSAGIARCGYEDRIDISQDIDCSLKSFLNVLNYSSIDEVVSQNKNGKYCFKKDLLLWPCNYHLKILAFTKSWRTAENIRQLAKSIEHLLSFSDFNYPVYTKVKGYPKAPYDAFIRPIEKFDVQKVKGTWFEKMELFARCGIIPHSTRLLDEMSLLKETINDEGVCQTYIDEPFFKNWGPYSGLKLEENWHKETKKQCDITFRALLIMNYAEKDGLTS